VLFNERAENTSELVEKWNVAGRSHITKLNKVIAEAKEKQKEPENWPKDSRTVEQARLVISLVEDAEREGRWCTKNPVVDRAHEPFIGMLGDVCQNLNCVTILGADEFLVRLGTAYQPESTIHVRGSQVTKRPDILAVALSLATARCYCWCKSKALVSQNP